MSSFVKKHMSRTQNKYFVDKGKSLLKIAKWGSID